jgi:DNA-binding NarL/FixJ family response regulator
VPIRVLLVDDQPLVRAGLAMLLSARDDIEVVGEVGDGEEAVDAAARLRPDVVLMDVRMPGMSGLEATRLIARNDPSDGDSIARIIMLTNYHVDDEVYAALRAGASGFVLKDAVPDELISAIRAVADGEAWLDPAVTHRLLADFAARPESGVPPPVTMSQLTPREREVLILVAHGMTNTEIARHLLIGEATVKTHFARVIMKLGLRDRAQAVSVAFKSGLVNPRDHPPALPGQT